MQCLLCRILPIICIMSCVPRVSPADAQLHPTQWYVHPDGDDQHDCSTNSTACRTITSALDKAVDGDRIVVAAGLYFESLTITKSVDIQGARDAPTILDGQNSHWGVVIRHSVTATTSINVSLSFLTIQHAYASSGYGAAIYNADNLMVHNTAILSNTATAGGTIYNTGVLTLTNVTLSRNASSGAIYGARYSTTTLTNVTISENSVISGGILQFDGTSTPTCHPPLCSDPPRGQFALRNVILAHNMGSNCYAPFAVYGQNMTSFGGNLSDDTTCRSFLGSGHDRNAVDANLLPLRDNGGPTRTYALPPGSPAVNSGQTLGCPSTDQRGMPRPYVELAPRCDSGAYELQLSVLYLPAIYTNQQ